MSVFVLSVANNMECKACLVNRFAKIYYLELLYNSIKGPINL
jgi:hypothetical protein